MSILYKKRFIKKKYYQKKYYIKSGLSKKKYYIKSGFRKRRVQLLFSFSANRTQPGAEQDIMDTCDVFADFILFAKDFDRRQIRKQICTTVLGLNHNVYYNTRLISCLMVCIIRIYFIGHLLPELTVSGGKQCCHILFFLG